MFDETNLCHLEVRDPNPPEVIADKFETKAQAVLDSISTHASSTGGRTSQVTMTPEQKPTTDHQISASLKSAASTTPQVIMKDKEAPSFAASASDTIRSSKDTGFTRIVPTVRPTRTKLKQTVNTLLGTYETKLFRCTECNSFCFVSVG